MSDSTSPGSRPLTTSASFAAGAFFGMSMQQYLDMPAVSQSLLQTMLDRCPKAAWFESWLNPNRVRETNDVFDAGTIAHQILLEGNADGIEVIDPYDYLSAQGNVPDGWTNKAIRLARDNARAAGKTPILKSNIQQIAEMVAAAMEFIDGCKDTEPVIYEAFQPNGGHSEATFTWLDGDVPCRIRTDRITKDMRHVIDYKSGAFSVEPDQWGRTKYASQGLYIGAAFYRRGIRAHCGHDCTYTYLAQENEPPYLCSLIGVDPPSFALGEAKVETAMSAWGRHLLSNVWPGYSPRIAYPELPAYVGAQWSEKELENVWP